MTVGVRWGVPPRVAVKAEPGVLIVSRFTGQAWLVRGKAKYLVETGAEEILREKREAEAKRRADSEADVNQVLELLRQDEQERRTGR